MLCMTFFFCAPLQSAGGFILEGDWTPTKMNLFYSPPIEVGVLSPFKINIRHILIDDIILEPGQMLIWQDQASAKQSASIIDQ